MLDRWTWSLDSSGDFSVKSVRNLIDDYILPSKDVPTRWVKVIPININSFACRVFLDKLPTRLDLSLRGVNISSIVCPLCDASVESSSHLFFTCPLVCQVRSKVSRWWELDDPVLHSYDEWLTWFNNIRLSKNLKALFEGVCYVMWWSIWRFRNRLLFDKCNPRKELIFDDIVQMTFNWCSSRCNFPFNWVTWMQNHNLISM
ncbi:RNA-directed DNA polymerase, eukaryota [Tanacetum coccineum]